MPKQIQKIDERRKAAANYIVNFYNEVEALKQNCIVYSNFLLQLKKKFDMENVPETEKRQLMDQSMNVRYYVLLSYHSHKGIRDSVNIPGDDGIEKAYNIVKDQLIIKEEDAFKYMNEIVKFMLSEVISTLLETSQNIVSEIFYDDGGSKKEPQSGN